MQWSEQVLRIDSESEETARCSLEVLADHSTGD